MCLIPEDVEIVSFLSLRLCLIRFLYPIHFHQLPAMSPLFINVSYNSINFYKQNNICHLFPKDEAEM